MSARRISSFLAACLLGAATATPIQVKADDTEIYLGNASLSEGIQPNVLFILDTSGSMSSYDGQAKDRLDRMKEALHRILDEANNINVGLMRFTDPGGPILFPVSDINADAEEVVSAGQADVAVRISDSADDAEQLGTAVILDSSQLELVEVAMFGTEGSIELQIAAGADDAEQSPLFMNNSSNQIELTDDGSGNRTDGWRFNGVTIPQGATVLHAELDFRSRSNRDGTTNLTFVGHDVDDSPTFPNSPSSSDTPYDRLGALTTASVDWNDVPEWFTGERYSTPNLASIVQEIVGRPGWASGNSLTFLATGTAGSLRHSSSYNDSPSRAAIFRATYVDGAGGGDQIVGLRFRDVRIPQGVTIQRAVVEFVPAVASTTTTSLSVRAQAADDADAFTTTANDIDGRPRTTAAVTWTPPAWDVGTSQQTPDLAAVVQEVVDRAGWCGGNDIAIIIESAGDGGPRSAVSFDGDPAFAPVLRVDFDPNTPLAAGEGCIEQSVQSQVASGNDDAEQVGSSLYLTSSTLEMTTVSGNVRDVGYRFQNLDIPQGATIVSAEIDFVSKADRSEATSLTFRGHASDDSPVFSATYGQNVSTRTTTSASVDWSSIPSWSNGATYTSPNLATVVQEIVDRAGWQAGNSMAFIVTGTGRRDAYAFNSSAANAASLRVTYRASADTGTGTITTVRDRLREIVDDLEHDGYTPIVDTLYEAARYYRGEGVHYGKTRGSGSTSVRRNTRVSHPASYADGSVSRPAGCTDSNLNAVECINEQITGSAVYTSPIQEACQANYIVLLTDGFANHNHSAGLIRSMTGDPSCISTMTDGTSVDAGESCGIDLTEFLANDDQNGDVAGDNTVTTYTIGFNISNQFLRDVATAGGGRFYEASTADELVNVFQAIIAEALSRTTSFATPSLSVNAFNKLFHRNEVYFSLFKPEPQSRWVGNVKKYQLCSDPNTGCELGEILDSTAPPDGPKPAIGDDNRIADTARSFWSDVTDGTEILEGGAGNEVPAWGSRRLYAYSGAGAPSNVDLTLPAHTVTDSNSAITVEMLGGSTDVASPLYMSASERTSLIEWIRGKDVDDEDVDGSTSDDRYTFADPLHSSPVAITYGGTDSDPVIKLFVGTNDGALRMINAHSGIEEWLFYPQAMLANQRTLRANSSGPHVYGIDGTPTVWVNDEDRDSVIEPAVDVNGDGTNEFVRVFTGMRRGGNSVFAIDATPTTVHGPLTDKTETNGVSPRLLWQIDGGGVDFPRLGETWSRPRLATIAYGTTTEGERVARNVLVFAGGYDDSQDTGFGTSGMGNAIYFVDPEDGSRLFWISSHGSVTHGGSDGVTVPDMIYPIPSDVALMDADSDGLIDRLYVGDTGGQVWRVDLAADTSVTAGIKATVGKLATVSDGSADADKRKFFYPPDVVQVRDSTYSTIGHYDLVVVVTGDRSSPLNTSVQDRFYAFRDYTVSAMTDGDPADPDDDDGLADGYTTLQGKTTAQVGDLFDVTDVNAPTGQDLTDLQSADGYFLDLEANGEKGLAAPIILAGVVFFTTYMPEAQLSGHGCTLAEGGGRLYGLNVLNGAAAYDWDESGDPTLTKSDRVYTLGSGIPSSAVPIFQEKGITLLIGGGGGATTINPLIGLPRNRTYWFEETN
ncbi:MAG: VWA domain-containing protein [Chromatiales bacterium]|nr:VWA domain-containing protein [Chromatiales bacterium]